MFNKGNQINKGRKPWNKDKKGLQVSWIKGKHQSQEVIEKIRNNRKGKGIGNKNGFIKGMIPHNKGKLSPWTTKMNIENNPNKGGNTSPLWEGGKIGYNSKQVLLRENYTCQKCGLRDIEIMEVDHILPKSIYPELYSDINNLQVLCPNCHRRKTLKDRKDIVIYKRSKND